MDLKTSAFRLEDQASFYRGFAGPGVAWSFGWSWKRNASGESQGIPFYHSSGKAIALGISGTHEKGDHLLKKENTDSSPTLHSALVAHASAAQADALSTALFVAGMDESMSFLSGVMPQPAVAVIEDQEVPRWNGVFHKFWGAPKVVSLALAVFSLSHFFLSQLAHAEDEAIDLGDVAAQSFTPYLTERNPYWMILPLVFIGIVILHLRKNRRKSS